MKKQFKNKSINYLMIALLFCFVNTKAQFSLLNNFTGGTDGSNPFGTCVSDGTFLYGMTYGGGTNNLGTLFKIKPDGTGYSKLIDFSGTLDGSYPVGSLMYDGTYLYGMTTAGGINNMGVVFKIMPNGTGFNKLMDFSGALNGRNSQGTLVSDGTFLYGITYQGGSNDQGTIFKIMPNGSGYAKLMDFVSPVTGGNPIGGLIYDGTYLYGQANFGGTGGLGVVFKVLSDGSGYTKLLEFSGTNGNGPYGSLLADGANLYGMTRRGGLSDLGTLFKITTSGTGYTKLIDFAGSSNGSYPEGSMISDGTYLYGLTRNGGTSNTGTMFKLLFNGTGYSKLIDFSSPVNGSNPRGSLISDGTFHYGMTFQGGTNNLGTVFKYQYCNLVTANASQTNVCSSNTITLTANSGATSYTWSGGVTNNVAFTPSVTNTYSVIATGSGICSNTATITVNVNPTPTLVTLSSNTIICSMQSATLNVSGANTYSWNTSSNSSSISITPTITTTYSVMGTNSFGCVSNAIITQQVNALPNVIAISNNTLLCVGETASLTASGANTFTWSTTENTNSIVVTPTVTTSYSVTGIDNNGCSNSSTITQSVSLCTGIAQLANESLVSVFPNPFLNIITIKTSTTKNTIIIVDVLGKVVYEKQSLSNKIEMDLSYLNSGFYQLFVTGDHNSYSRKIIKQ